MGNESSLPKPEECIPGRDESMKVTNEHYVLRPNKIQPPFPEGFESCVFGTGCFWGTEKGFWRMPGVYATATGYCGGHTKNPTYKEVCSGRTGHNEVVRVVWDPSKISFADILRQFWESHDPTQGMGQGNDRGTQYRSGIYPDTEEQKKIAILSKDAYQKALGEKRQITTEICNAGIPFYYAEDYHQQYLAKPGARPYCSAQPTQVSLPGVDKWGPKTGQKNFLPATYWAKHAPTPHCVLRVPDAQIKLSSL